MLSMTRDPEARFPIGATISLAELHDDPYPAYRRLREKEPISWIGALGMWFVTRHAHVRRLLLDSATLTTAWDSSLIHQTFGAQMLTTEGAEHDRYRRAAQPAFLGPNIRHRLEPAMRQATDQLIAGWGDADEIELRHQFASRLPIQTILMTFGLSLDVEGSMRGWYDSFERALANFAGDETIRSNAARSVAEFHAYLDGEIAAARASGTNDGLLGALLAAPPEKRLDDEAIKRNMSIIFFGGISTVEALILNMVWALAHDRATLERVRADRTLIPKVVEETMRWLSPVQSATRHVVRDMEFEGIALREGDVVNCMLGAANHDPAVFAEPERFDIDRRNLAEHLGFATGPHMCLGFRLAKAEAAVALDRLLTEFPHFALVPEGTTRPEGSEFRQPRSLTLFRRKG